MTGATGSGGQPDVLLSDGTVVLRPLRPDDAEAHLADQGTRTGPSPSPLGPFSRRLLPVALHQATADPGEGLLGRLLEPCRLAGADEFAVAREQRLAWLRVGVPQAALQPFSAADP